MPASSPPTAPPARRVGGRAAALPDEDAFARLLVGHRPRLEAYARRMTGDAAQAEDVVQEVFVAALRALRGGAVPDDPGAWLHAIARRACVDEHRRRGRRVEAAPGTTGTADADLVAADADGDDPVPLAWGRRRDVRVLQAAFGDLSPVQHDVLVQRELEGRSSDEIAARTGLARGAVEGHLARGRRALRAAYGELDSGERCRDVRRLCTPDLGRQTSPAHRRARAHLRACAPCRRHALAAGVEVPRARRAGAFLLLPFGALRGLVAGAGDGAVAAAGAKLAPVVATVAVAGVAVPLAATSSGSASRSPARTATGPARPAAVTTTPVGHRQGVRVATAVSRRSDAVPSRGTRHVAGGASTTGPSSGVPDAAGAGGTTPGTTAAAAPGPVTRAPGATVAGQGSSAAASSATPDVPKVVREVAAPVTSGVHAALAPVVPKTVAAAKPVAAAIAAATPASSGAASVVPRAEGALGAR